MHDAPNISETRWFMTSMLRSLALSLVTVALYSSLALAQDGQLGTAEPEIEPARPSVHADLGRMDNSLSLMLLLGFGYDSVGFGVGARYQKTLVPEGFIRNSSVTDDLGIEGSFEFRHHSWDDDWSYNEIDIAAGVVWNLWFTERFAAYPKLGLGYGFGWFSDDYGQDESDYGGFFLLGAVGVLYKLDAVTLRAEIGSQSLQLGVAFTF
jgi:hypothetical protein